MTIILISFVHRLVGVLKEWYVGPILSPGFYSNITPEIDNEWKNMHSGKNVNQTIRDYLVTYIGEPITQLLRY